MKIILTPIDFSSVTPHVVDEAAKLAQAFDGIVALLNVNRVSPETKDFGMDSASIAELMRADERRADRQLAQLKEALQQRGVAVESLRSTGSPVADILDQAKTLSADYIVMGSHGHTAFYDLVIGGTSSAVIKKARCPVIIVTGRRESSKPVQPEVEEMAGALAES